MDKPTKSKGSADRTRKYREKMDNERAKIKMAVAN